MTGRHALRAIGWMVAAAALAVGAPILFWVLAGWPLPHAIPQWGEVSAAISAGRIPAAFVTGALATACWLAWARIVWSLVLSVVDERRGHARDSRMAGGVGQYVGRRLVASTALVFSMLGPRVAMAQTAPPPPVVATATDATTTTQGATPAPATETEWAGPTVTVVKDDCLWDLAESHLGDPFRWLEIYALNEGRVQPDGGVLAEPDLIYPGWELRLPADSIVSPTDASDAGTPSPGEATESVPQAESNEGAAATALPVTDSPAVAGTTATGASTATSETGEAAASAASDAVSSDGAPAATGQPDPGAAVQPAATLGDEASTTDTTAPFATLAPPGTAAPTTVVDTAATSTTAVPNPSATLAPASASAAEVDRGRTTVEGEVTEPKTGPDVVSLAMVGGGLTVIAGVAAFSIDRVRAGRRGPPSSKSTRHPGGRHRCISRDAAGAECRNRVEYEGERCTECWQSLAGASNAGTRAQLALKPDLPIDIFRALTQDPDGGVRRRAAQRTWLCCPSDDEHRVRQDHDPDPVPADALLAMLEGDQDEDDVFVRAELARNRRLPAPGQWLLLEDVEVETLRCLASSEALDGEVAERLVRCPDDRQVREWAQGRLDELAQEERVAG